MIRPIALAGLLLLGGCFSLFDYASRGSDGSSTDASFLKLTSPAENVARHFAELEAEKVQLEKAVADGKVEAAEKQAQLDVIEAQKLVLPAFHAQQNRLQAALGSTPAGQRSRFANAAAISKAGTIAANAMVAARGTDVGAEKTQRDAVAASTAQLRAELTRLGVAGG